MASTQEIIEQTEDLLEKWKHPDPYRPPTAPGGSKYQRNLPVPSTDRTFLEFTTSHMARMDYVLIYHYSTANDASGNARLGLLGGQARLPGVRKGCIYGQSSNLYNPVPLSFLVLCCCTAVFIVRAALLGEVHSNAMEIMSSTRCSRGCLLLRATWLRMRVITLVLSACVRPVCLSLFL